MAQALGEANRLDLSVRANRRYSDRAQATCDLFCLCRRVLTVDLKHDVKVLEDERDLIADANLETRGDGRIDSRRLSGRLLFSSERCRVGQGCAAELESIEKTRLTWQPHRRSHDLCSRTDSEKEAERERTEL